MFKVTWATLCGVHASGVCASKWPCGRSRKYARVQVSGVRVDVSDGRVCAGERADACVCTRACVDACVDVCVCATRTRVCARAHAWMRTLRHRRDFCARMCIRCGLDTLARGCVHYGAVGTCACVDAYTTTWSRLLRADASTVWLRRTYGLRTG
jgi:hypothetical protein